MLRLTEIVYLAAPFSRPEEIAFNRRLANVIRGYNFPLYMPQEAKHEIETGEPVPGAIEVSLVHTDGLTIGETPEERLSLISMEALNRANLVIAVYYGEEFDAVTAFEVGYAIGRRTNVVAIQNTLDGHLTNPPVDCVRKPSPEFCSRIVTAPHEDERLTDRLIPILNRYFVPHGIINFNKP